MQLPHAAGAPGFEVYRPPAEPSPDDEATGDLRRGKAALAVQLALQSVALFWYLMLLVSQAARLPNAQLRAPSNAYEAGYVVGTLLVTLWSAIALVWGPVNIRGIVKRRPWVFNSLAAYWGITLFTLFCLPVAALGLIHLYRSKARVALSSGTMR